MFLHLQIALIHSYCATYPFLINLVILAIKNDLSITIALRGNFNIPHRVGEGVSLSVFLPLSSLGPPSLPPSFSFSIFFWEALPFVQYAKEKGNIRCTVCIMLI